MNMKQLSNAQLSVIQDALSRHQQYLIDYIDECENNKSISFIASYESDLEITTHLLEDVINEINKGETQQNIGSSTTEDDKLWQERKWNLAASMMQNMCRGEDPMIVASEAVKVANMFETEFRK